MERAGTSTATVRPRHTSGYLRGAVEQLRHHAALGRFEGEAAHARRGSRLERRHPDAHGAGAHVAAEVGEVPVGCRSRTPSPPGGRSPRPRAARCRWGCRARGSPARGRPSRRGSGSSTSGWRAAGPDRGSRRIVSLRREPESGDRGSTSSNIDKHPFRSDLRGSNASPHSAFGAGAGLALPPCRDLRPQARGTRE
jgi:hypothetical protein